MGSGKRARLRRATAAPLKVAVMTATSSSAAGISLARDVELVKACALYADHIELVSQGAVLLASQAQLATSEEAWFDLLNVLDDDTLCHLLGRESLPENWRDGLAPLSSPEAMRHPVAAGIVRDFRANAAGARASMALTVEKLLECSGASNLLPAIDSGLVSLSPAGFSADSTSADDVMENWLALLRNLLVDKRTRLVLDDQVGRFAASLIREGNVKPDQFTMRHAGEAAVGSGLVARLPAFPDAPLDELLDLRNDLADPLGRYRTAVVRLAGRLHAGPFDADLPTELDDLWITDVQPALDDISEGMHQHGLLREMARAARDDVKTLIGSGAALYVGLDRLTSLNAWIAATAGLTSSAVAAAASGHATAAKEQGALRRQDLFYLYEVDRRLQQ